jgi:hypothetical protein
MVKIIFIGLFCFSTSPICVAEPAPQFHQNQKPTLLFKPEKNGFQIPRILLNYSVEEDRISIGNAIISEQTLKVFLGKPSSIEPKLKALTELSDKEIFIFTVPNGLINADKLEIISENGEVAWDYKYSPLDESLNLKIKPIIMSSLLENQSGINILASAISTKDIPILSGQKKGSFKFCVRQGDTELYTKICTPPYRLTQQNRKLKLQNELTPLRAYVNGQAAENNASITLNFNQVIHFFATSANQYTIEIKSKPANINLIDFYAESNSGQIVLTGYGAHPVHSRLKVLNDEDNSSWLTRIGWIPTIGDFKTYWSASIDPQDLNLRVIGEAGGQFIYLLKFDFIPLDTQRILIDANTRKSTYSSEIQIYGNAPLKHQVSSQEKSANLINESNGRFVWNFNTGTRGEEKLGSLLLHDSKNTWQGTYRIYRGFNSEFSMRLAGVASQSLQINTMAELAYNHWFDTAFDSNNDLLSIQRWGLSAKNFLPLKTFKLKKTEEAEVTLSLYTLDLKYRFTPGLWERDETWGLIIGYENVKLNEIQAPLLGAGFFWARSMPKIFDDLMNLLPFMKYNKWVDMDFTYYSTSLKKDITPGSNFAINFHGKVLWTKSFYGEAGFGFKSYEYKDLNIKKYASLKAFYGTMGLGLNF